MASEPLQKMVEAMAAELARQYDRAYGSVEFIAPNELIIDTDGGKVFDLEAVARAGLETTRDLLIAAFRAGFAASAEGWNGEWGAPPERVDAEARVAADAMLDQILKSPGEDNG